VPKPIIKIIYKSIIAVFGDDNMKNIKYFLCFLVFAFASCITPQKTKKDELSLPPRKLGIVTAAVLKRGTSTLLPRDYSFVLITKTQTIRIHHKLMGDNIWIFFPPEERKTLIASFNTYLDTYKEGFERKTQKAFFGSQKIEMVWGLLNVAHKAYPTARFEYEYINNKPYFVIASKTVESEKNDANSPAIKIVLSPSQVRKIIALINDDAISLVMQNLRRDFEEYDDEFDDDTKEDDNENKSQKDDFDNAP